MSAGMQDKSARTRLLPKAKRSEDDALIARMEQELYRAYGDELFAIADWLWNPNDSH